VKLESRVDQLAVSSTRIMCAYDENKKVTTVHFDAAEDNNAVDGISGKIRNSNSEFVLQNSKLPHCF
jgi:hypothetical protein